MFPESPDCTLYDDTKRNGFWVTGGEPGVIEVLKVWKWPIVHRSKFGPIYSLYCRTQCVHCTLAWSQAWLRAIVQWTHAYVLCTPSVCCIVASCYDTTHRWCTQYVCCMCRTLDLFRANICMRLVWRSALWSDEYACNALAIRWVKKWVGRVFPECFRKLIPSS